MDAASRSRALIAAAIVLALGAAITIYLMRERPSPPAETAAEGVAPAPRPRLLLQYLPGGETEDAALRLTFFFIDPDARQAAGEGAPAALGLTVEPAEWRDRVRLTVSDPGSETQTPLDQGLTLVQSPAAAEIELGPRTGAVLLYRLAVASKPRAGRRLRAVARLPMGEVESNHVVVPDAPSDEAMRTEQQARAALALGDYERLSSLAAALVAQSPDEFGGHWYQGIGLEAQGRDAEALQAYERALDRLPAGARRDPATGAQYFADPSLSVFERVRRLRARMAPQPPR